LLFFNADAMETLQPAAFALLEHLHIEDSSTIVMKAHYEKELMNRAFTLTLPTASEELVRLLKMYTNTKL
ncbi:MAG TPA: hypothetical protein VK202_00610, partial [Bacteroidia bacterium]|nr:hypothetical protein [Bacteroidia bacterium]